MTFLRLSHCSSKRLIAIAVLMSCMMLLSSGRHAIWTGSALLVGRLILTVTAQKSGVVLCGHLSIEEADEE